MRTVAVRGYVSKGNVIDQNHRRRLPIGSLKPQATSRWLAADQRRRYALKKLIDDVQNNKADLTRVCVLVRLIRKVSFSH